MAQRDFSKLNEKKNHLYCFLSFIFMFQIVVTIGTIAVVAKLTIRKTITVSEDKNWIRLKSYFK